MNKKNASNSAILALGRLSCRECAGKDFCKHKREIRETLDSLATTDDCAVQIEPADRDVIEAIRARFDKLFDTLPLDARTAYIESAKPSNLATAPLLLLRILDRFAPPTKSTPK